MKKLTSLLLLLGLLGNAQASWGVGILPKEDDINIDDDLRALEAVLIRRGKRGEGKGVASDQSSRSFPSWPWGGPGEDEKDNKDGEEEEKEGDHPPHKNPLWPWTEERKNDERDKEDRKRPPREKPLWPWRIPEEDLERSVRRPPPIHPWGREDLELPPYDGPFVMSRHPGKLSGEPGKGRKLPPLNVREYRRRRFIKALERSLDRTRGKTGRVIREPCHRCRQSGGKGPSCRACWSAGEGDEGNRPIHPWHRRTASKGIITTVKKQPGKSPTRHVDQKLILLKKDKENRLIEVNQINLHFDVDVRQQQQQQQQEKQGIAHARKLGTGRRTRQNHHHAHRARSPHKPARHWRPEADMERWLQRRYNYHMAPALVYRASAESARKLRARRHPMEMDPKYPPSDEDGLSGRRHSYNGKGSHPREDVEDDQSLGKRMSKAWKALKRVLKQWGKSIKNYLGEASKCFEGESTANKIALLLVVGLIVTLQAMAAIKIVNFCREKSRRNDDASYIRLPTEADEKSMI